MNFYVGQKFSKYPPPQISQWCKENNMHIAKEGDKYVVVKNAHVETKEIKTFSKFNIWVATQQMEIVLEDGTKTTVWAEFERFMEKTLLPSGATLLSGWLQINDLVEDNPFFEEFYPQAVSVFGKELVDKVLSQSVSSTKEVVVG
jgi:hypothetical protein